MIQLSFITSLREQSGTFDRFQSFWQAPGTWWIQNYIPAPWNGVGSLLPSFQLGGYKANFMFPIIFTSHIHLLSFITNSH